MQDSPILSEYQDGLEHYFATETRAYTDDDCQRISTHLVANDRPEWARIPRIYIVLRLLDQVHTIEYYLRNEINDLYLPFRTVTQLPLSLPLAHRERFLEKQEAVLTKSISLEKGLLGKKHVHFPKGERFPYEELGSLGRGRYAEVTRVRSPFSGEIFARKRFQRVKKSPKGDVKSFLNELAVLKRIEHAHCVQLIGSYTDSNSFGILMRPVAQWNLQQFLSHAESHEPAQAILRTFFGCLANALQYVHEKQIRHRDIKPENILVNERTVYLADFGISLDWEHLSCSTTTAEAAKTRMYCAPEVDTQFQKRNSSTDVWSLGCVFTEMLVVVQGYRVQELMNAFHDNSETRIYYQNLPVAHNWLEHKLLVDEPRAKILSEIIVEMLSEDPQRRPSASGISVSLSVAEDGDVPNTYCGECCLNETEVIEELSDDSAWEQDVASPRHQAQASRPATPDQGDDPLPEAPMMTPARSPRMLDTSSRSSSPKSLNATNALEPMRHFNTTKASSLLETAPMTPSTGDFLTILRHDTLVQNHDESSHTKTSLTKTHSHTPSSHSHSTAAMSSINHNALGISTSPTAVTSKILYVSDELRRRGTRRGACSEVLDSISFEPWPPYRLTGDLPTLESSSWNSPSALLDHMKAWCGSATANQPPDLTAHIETAETQNIPEFLHFLMCNGLKIKASPYMMVIGENWWACPARIPVAQLLIAYGFANTPGTPQNAPVIEAIRLDDFPLLESLLKAGLDPDDNEKLKGQATPFKVVNRGPVREHPLLFAVHSNRCDAVAALLRHGAKGRNYDTMLAAIRCRHWDAAKLLEKAGVDQCKPEKACLCLYYASESRRPEVLVWLWTSGRHDITCVEKSPQYLPSALFLSCRRGDVEMVKLLLSIGANPRATSRQQNPKNPRSALTTAAENGHKAVVELLLKADVGINEVGPEGVTALCHASNDMAKYLVSHGAKRLTPPLKEKLSQKITAIWS